ncbi:hypothetical protein [Pseudomonas mosselii]|uniref:hypothetical protein n=1 Tax=Pseudomonas mosselii TaxID=78327 RepID=UPI0021D7E00C|nr:hypothetical protein [Pseudomonas mosselii]MCU9527534.1 hypothetical protein [Pseudomonas mosselii]MCU9534847.1 hypothetical protein [Pseudomonas mosselii]MCU9542781.1 hypothetical protein [Pseudomonas mosselii]MCU9546687.1 hypothetical protein [Pseudomonas mosselii]
MTDIERLKSLLGLIDTVPRDAALPAMPGFDRDEVDALIEEPGQADPVAVSEAVGMAADWIDALPKTVKSMLPDVPG